ncbi:MAG: hypothetical protein H0U26_04325 [Acidimicrobiia bacterium]|nr:hypothetical protein [Acidimicrobiia bacterium]
MREAGRNVVGPLHAVAAIVRDGNTGPAAEVLRELGLTGAGLHERLARYGEPTGKHDHTTFNPAWNRLIDMATGLALGSGDAEVTDEHVLLALAYGRSSLQHGLLEDLGIDPEVVVSALAERGVQVPTLGPPARARPIGLLGPRISFGQDDHRAITTAMIERWPPGTGLWGFNTDGAGGYWLVAEAALDAVAVARAAVTDPDRIVVEPAY